jgi:hypothetical protein
MQLLLFSVINVWTPEKLNSKRAARKNHLTQSQNLSLKKPGPPEPFPNEMQKLQLRMHHEQLQRQQLLHQQFLQQRQQQMAAQHLYFNSTFQPQHPLMSQSSHLGQERFNHVSLPHHNNLSNPMLNCYTGSDASLDSIPGSSISGPARVIIIPFLYHGLF